MLLGNSPRGFIENQKQTLGKKCPLETVLGASGLKSEMFVVLNYLSTGWSELEGLFFFLKPGGEEVNHRVNKGQNLMTKVLDKVGRLVFKGRIPACSLRVGGRMKGGSAFLGLPLEV